MTLGILVTLFAVVGAAAGHLLDVLATREISAKAGSPKSPPPTRSTQTEATGRGDLLSLRVKPGGYPVCEVCTAVLFVLVGLLFGPHAPRLWAAPALCYLAAVAVVLTKVDLRTSTIPDRIVLPSYPIAVVLLAVASLGTGEWSQLGRAGIGAATLAAAYLTLALVNPRGMGLGDVKLAGLLGLYLAWADWGALVVGTLAAFLLGEVFAIVLLTTGRAARGSQIPFGPWMLLGAGVGIVVGEPLWTGYLALTS